MSGYLRFSVTEVPCVDGILKALENAGDAYHHTEYWWDTDVLEESCVESIEKAAKKAAEHIDDLERQLAEANAKLGELKMEIEAANGAADYQARIADEAKAEIARLKEDLMDYHLQDADCRKAAGEFDKSDSFGIECPLTIIKRMKAEIEADDRNVNNLMDQVYEMSKELEAMRQMVEACKALYEVHNQELRAVLDQCPCLTCQWYRDYLERKQS